jgi:RNA polymerase sigma factor (sigma-70 family)
MRDRGDLRNLADEDLAQVCSRRPINEEAWRELWRRFYPYVRGKVENLLAPFPALAQSQQDDIVQYAFLNIFQRLPHFDPRRSPLRAYLGIVVTSSVFDQMRVHKRDRLVPLEEIPELGGRVMKGEFELDALFSITKTVIAQMEPRNQKVLQEFLEGEKPEAISGRLHISKDAIYATVYRFRRKLKAALSEAGLSVRNMQ